MKQLQQEEPPSGQDSLLAAQIDKITDMALQEKSGVIILKTGDESLLSRLSIVNSAKESIDLQYYAIHNDLTANILIEAVLLAADRGVRIRLLIDDISIGRVRKNLLALDSLENIDIRIFNPVNKINQHSLARIIAFFARLPKSTRRMHNKAMIVDRTFCITGGRNLGDEYFDAHQEMAFKDIDVLSQGPVATKIAASFDLFWNDRNSYPIGELYPRKPSTRYIHAFRHELMHSHDRQLLNDIEKQNLSITLDQYLELFGHSFRWVSCDFITDHPMRVRGEDNPDQEAPVQRILSLAEKAKKELLVITAYFVPGANGVAWLSTMVERGIDIHVVTNSLASTDVIAVHTGYRRHRPALLKKGIELFELRPTGHRRKRQRFFARTAPSYASLHAKSYILDRETSIIGSLNFDPRSARLNTESALIIHDHATAMEMVDVYHAMTSPKVSYKLSIKNGRLSWNEEENGIARTLYNEPGASLWRKTLAFLIGLLPIEDQL